MDNYGRKHQGILGRKKISDTKWDISIKVGIFMHLILKNMKRVRFINFRSFKVS